MAETVTIERRFRGPPQSANGGYTCGAVARAIDSRAAEVTLRLPPPLEHEMLLQRGEDDRVELRDGDSVVAEARPLEGVEVETPEPVSLPVAEAAREASPLHAHHPWPMCFVCGPDRGRGDGLRVICGPVEGRTVVASPWETEGPIPLEGAAIALEMVWSALDCPSGNALMQVPGAPVAALGRLSASIDADLQPGETYVAVGWPIGRDGRKHHTGSAIFSREGVPLARASAVWIELRDDKLNARV
jgi:hypothetical protein